MLECVHLEESLRSNWSSLSLKCLCPDPNSNFVGFQSNYFWIPLYPEFLLTIQSTCWSQTHKIYFQTQSPSTQIEIFLILQTEYPRFGFV